MFGTAKATHTLVNSEGAEAAVIYRGDEGRYFLAITDTTLLEKTTRLQGVKAGYAANQLST